jgi:hypothetical protein
VKPGDPVEAKPRPGLGGWLPVQLIRRQPNGRYLVELGNGERCEVPSARIRARTNGPGRPRRVVSFDARPDRAPSYELPPAREASPKDPPKRSSAYLRYVRQQACVGCGAPAPSDPHHWGARGMGQKTDDYRTVPLCRRCHDHFHQGGWIPPHNALETRLLLLKAQVDLLVAWVSASA